MMRAAFLIGVACLLSGAAWADESVAGSWKAELGSGVEIVMDVTANGHWDSQTTQSGAVVAKMDGIYRQTKQSATSGNLVFTPTEAKTSGQHGAPSVEHDAYRLADGGRTMRLTSGGDTMVFHKQ